MVALFNSVRSASSARVKDLSPILKAVNKVKRRSADAFPLVAG